MVSDAKLKLPEGFLHGTNYLFDCFQEGIADYATVRKRYSVFYLNAEKESTAWYLDTHLRVMEPIYSADCCYMTKQRERFLMEQEEKSDAAKRKADTDLAMDTKRPRVQDLLLESGDDVDYCGPILGPKRHANPVSSSINSNAEISS